MIEKMRECIGGRRRWVGIELTCYEEWQKKKKRRDENLGVLGDIIFPLVTSLNSIIAGRLPPKKGGVDT